MSNDSILESPTNTDGFIDAQSGTVKTALPPNSRSFILGPLVDGYNCLLAFFSDSLALSRSISSEFSTN